MAIPLFVVDTFTDTTFAGNSAGVRCIVRGVPSNPH